MSNVVPLRAHPESRDVHKPGELSETEEWRMVAWSRKEIDELEHLGMGLVRLGSEELGTRLLAKVLAWKVAPR